MQIKFSLTKSDYYRDKHTTNTVTLGASNFSGQLMPQLVDYITSVNGKPIIVENKPPTPSKTRGAKRKRYLSQPQSLTIDESEYVLDARKNELLEFILKVLKSWLCSDDNEKVIGIKQHLPVSYRCYCS